jgi:cytoskeletal protein CcmA (bactofilin family)
MNESAGSEVTVVGKGARLEGTIVSAGSLRIDGQVKGKITADGDVMLSSQSHVEADIQANNATVAGRFKGNLVVKAKAEVARGGHVDGNITSMSLVVLEGAVFTGQSIMGDQSGHAVAQHSASADTRYGESGSGDGAAAAFAASEAEKARSR